MTASCISRWVDLSPREGNLQPLLPSPSLWWLYFTKALWASKPHFMEFAPHLRLLYHRTSLVLSDLRAEKESLFCPRSPKLPAAWESTFTTQLLSFFTLCSLGSCFCKTMRTLLISCSPSPLFLPQPPEVGARCPLVLQFSGRGHGGGGGMHLPLGCG